ncbi:MAG: ATP-binding protein, partial [Pseudomonadota bacterium]
VKTLVVCEEAHRYIPKDQNSGFAPTRSAIARIAKEGRKYGVSIAIITQRPNELDATILSQCNTIFAMRLGNDADQAVMTKAIANGSRSSLAFLSSLADRECIAFGSAVSTPMRLKFRNVPAHIRPSSQNVSDGSDVESVANTALSSIVANLRGSAHVDDAESDDWVVHEDKDTPLSAAPKPQPDPEPKDTPQRRSLLRRRAS